MIKRYKKKASGQMQRTTRIYLTNVLNKSKIETLKSFLINHKSVIQYFIEMFWSNKDMSSDLADKSITDNAVKKYGITARLAQQAAKQAKEIILSQRKKSMYKRTMPLFKNIVINLDSRFVQVSKFDGHFDWALEFESGVPKLVVPFHETEHFKKFTSNGWRLGTSIRLGIRKNNAFVDIFFLRPKPELKKSGKILGIDLGYRVPIATSDKELIGSELKEKIEKSGKRRKSFHQYIQSELNRILKSIDLSNTKMLVLENLKNVKKGKRGKFSRRTNRLLSFWHYARVIGRLRQTCEELGIQLELKSPWKTSQRCPACGKIDKRNRRDTEFRCVHCGFEEHSDIVGALNLKSLGLAGVNSLRLLKTCVA
jgi:IS605 OrfB family transposase